MADSRVDDMHRKAARLLATEESLALMLRETAAAKRLAAVRSQLLEHVREVVKTGDLSLIVTTERAIVEGDLERYANSRSMTSSLRTALNELAAVERHIDIVDDIERYRAVDLAHRLPRNRRAGLPFDEARQALASHQARLNNLDKSRLGDDEKQLVEARREAILAAAKLYAVRQAKALGE